MSGSSWSFTATLKISFLCGSVSEAQKPEPDSVVIECTPPNLPFLHFFGLLSFCQLFLSRLSLYLFLVPDFRDLVDHLEPC